MLDVLRRGMLLGLGLASLTREKAEKIGEEMVRKGELSTGEAKEFIENLVKKGQEEQSCLRAAVKEEFEGMRQRFDFVKKSDLDDLEKRVSELENRLNSTGN